MEQRSYAGTRSENPLLRFVDHGETYGPVVMKDFLGECGAFSSILDIGAGNGRDLEIARTVRPQATRSALEVVPACIENLRRQNIATCQANIEQDPLPFLDESLDVVIANQVLEHTKELFWILHEISRVLKVGGHAIFGVPNVASMHNRIRLLLGRHPSQAKACSAHIRIFSKPDFMLFLEEGFPGGYTLKKFAGSQFYPLPQKMSRIMSTCLPTCAFSIFFLLQKNAPYADSFARYPAEARLETNYKCIGR